MSSELFYARLPNGVLTSCEEHLPPEGGAIVGVALVLAHAAGAAISGEFMQAFASGLAQRGVPTTLFNFSYAEEGRRLPDRVEKLVGELGDVVTEVRRRRGRRTRVFMGGKSMGGRVATLLAADGFRCAGLVLLGYPLHQAEKTENLRCEHFPKIKVPTLFVSGTRDRLAKQELLRAAVKKVKGPHVVRWIQQGDHSLEVPRSVKRSRDAVWGDAMDIVVSFVRKYAKG